MPITDDFRKNLSNTTPVRFAAGTADLAAEKLRALPATFDRLREQAPERLQNVRETELPRLREQAQSLALQGVGAAMEYAVKARQTYEELAERGKGAMENWNTERAGAEEETPQVIVERAEPVSVTKPVTEPVTEPATAGETSATPDGAAPAQGDVTKESAAKNGSGSAGKPTAGETTAEAPKKMPPQA